MQQLDAITLKALAQELSLLLDGAKVSKMQHPSAHEFLITFWGGADRKGQQAENRNLFYIQLNPEAPFCVLTGSKQRQDTVLNTFSKPTALCMLLRKLLGGANIVEIRTLPGERVLELVFENFNELGNKVRLVLSLELMGKHSNMLLYDDVQGVLLAVAHGVSEVMSSYRELAAGLPYAPPPAPVGKRLLSGMTFNDFSALWQAGPLDKPDTQAAYLNRNLVGFGLRMLEDALSKTSDAKTVYQQLNALEAGQNLAPAITRDGARFTLISPDNDSQWHSVGSVNNLVEAYFMTHLRELRLNRRRQQLRQWLETQTKKLQRREKELAPVSDSEIAHLQATGDRLLGAFSAQEVSGNSPHKGTIALSNYETGEPWHIDVDPSCGWVENAQIYYRRAKKAKARKAAHQQMSEQLNNERTYLETLRQLMEQAETLAELDAIEADIIAAGFTKKSDRPDTRNGKQGDKKKNEPVGGVMTLHSSDGIELLVGKSGQGNEAIVGKLSKPEDVWLHVHQMPGSHVLIRCGRDGDIPDQTLLEATMLAVWYSSARHSVNVPVIYTQSKFVRKIPQSYPGHVNYRQEKTVFITPEETMLEKLLAGQN